MRTHRPLRVQSLLQRELAGIIMREVDFPAGVLVTVSDIILSSKKMEEAKVMVSVLPSEAADGVIKTLEKERGLLQHLLNKKMNIKPMPHIIFYHDRGLEHAALVEKLLMETGEDLQGEVEDTTA